MCDHLHVLLTLSMSVGLFIATLEISVYHAPPKYSIYEKITYYVCILLLIIGIAIALAFKGPELFIAILE